MEQTYTQYSDLGHSERRDDRDHLFLCEEGEFVRCETILKMFWERHIGAGCLLRGFGCSRSHIDQREIAVLSYDTRSD
jgi:hypothetical protein